MSHDLLVQMAHYGRIYLINMIAMLREGTLIFIRTPKIVTSVATIKVFHPQNSKSLYRSNLRNLSTFLWRE